MDVFKTIILTTIVFQNDRCYKTRFLLMIVNNEPLLMIINDNPSLPIVNEETKHT